MARLASNATDNGCNEITPNDPASAPVMKGKSAEPHWPRAEMYPTAPPVNLGSSTAAVALMSTGKLEMEVVSSAPKKYHRMLLHRT